MPLISGRLQEMLPSTLENSTGIIVLVALFFWDNKKEEEQLAQISRDETLSRLPLRLSTNRIVELVQLRDTARPVSIILFIFSLICGLIVLGRFWMPQLIYGDRMLFHKLSPF